MRKRRELDAPADAFIYHVDVGCLVHHVHVGCFVHHVHVGSFVCRVDVVGSAVINGGAYAIHGCVVLPAH
jgi:hypothetical protein